MTLPLPTIVDLKAHLNYPDPAAQDDNDDELGYFLSAAIDLVEGMVGPLSPRSVTETHYAVSSDLLVLRKAPVVSLDAITGRPWAGTTTTTFLVSDYLLDTELGIVRSGNGLRLRGDYTVTYTAGRSGLPYGISLATVIIAAHLWATQRGAGPSAMSLQGGDDTAGAIVPMGFAVPNRAASLLEPYRQVKVA